MELESSKPLRKYASLNQRDALLQSTSSRIEEINNGEDGNFDVPTSASLGFRSSRIKQSLAAFTVFGLGVALFTRRTVCTMKLRSISAKRRHVKNDYDEKLKL